MRQIKIFLYRTPANQPQDSIWESLKDPINVIWKIILVLIAISPIFGIYSILSYLGDFNAKIIGFSLFSNIANLGAVLFYSYSIFGLFIFVIFILPFFLGYYYGGVLISELIIGCENYRNYFKKIYFDNGKKNLLYILLVALLIFGLFYLSNNHSIFPKDIESALYFIIGYLTFILLPPPKKLSDKLFGFATISLVFMLSFLLLAIISILHKDIILLTIINLFYTIVFFIYGLLLSNAKKANLKKDFRPQYKIIPFVLVASFIIANLIYFRIPFPKIAIGYSGIGNIQNVTFVLRAKTPICLKKQLLNTNQKNKKVKANQCGDTNGKAAAKKTSKPKLKTTPLFLLIQTSKYFYVEKYKKDKKLNKKDIIKLPKKYVTNIIP